MKTFEQEQMEQKHFEEKLRAAQRAQNLKNLLVDAAALVVDEAMEAFANFPPFRSTHEGFAILKEEVDELWEEVKCGNLDEAKQEAVQVAAMALRFLVDC